MPNGMNCECVKRVQYLVSRRRKDARLVESNFKESLQAFKNGIVEGEKELIARQLFRAGVYQACLDSKLSRHLELSEILSSLQRRISQSEPSIYELYLENKQRVEEQSNGVDIDKLLRGVLKSKESAKGLLEGNILREIGQVKVLAERMERLDKYLASWKESLRMEGVIDMKVIMDMHSP
jgi:hypothetical protein